MVVQNLQTWEIVSFPKSRIYFSNNVPRELADEVSEILGIDHTDDLGVCDEKKIHLLSWNTLQKDRKEGGLGILLRSKYCKGRCDLDMFSSKKNSSNVWQGIVENAKTVRQGTRFSVGNGSKKLFWDHYWATKTPLSSMAMSPIPIKAQDRTVEEYWNLNGLENGEWKWDELSTFLSGETLKMISLHSMNPSCEDEDFMYWCGSTIGNTHDLGSFEEETDKTTDLHQHCSRISPQKLETASQITRDAVTNPTTTASQDIATVSARTIQPII
ncbi:hypothetical protein Tco_1442889 [Tanacetum coccineum]